MSTSTKLPDLEIPGYEGVEWEKSSIGSTAGTLDDCVAFAALPDGDVALADTKTGTASTFRRSEIAALLAGAKNGDFDHLA